MSRKLFQMLLALLVCCAAGQLPGEYLVCKPIESLFAANSSLSDGRQPKVGPRGPPGPPGKRGPRGLQGPAGPVGPQPTIDVRLLDERIEASLKAKLNCSGGFLDGGYCYRLLYTSALTSSNQGGKQNAADLCAFHGGSLIDIETAQLYTKIYDHVKEAWTGWLDNPSRTYVEIWLASTYRSGNIVSSSGGEVYAKWYPNYPRPEAGDGLALLVNIHPRRSASDVGLFNTATSSKSAVPFCRFLQ